MTNQELIAELQQQDPNATVHIHVHPANIGQPCLETTDYQISVSEKGVCIMGTELL